MESWGVREGMRVGILGPNSYTWVLYDLASILLRATTVAFPEGIHLGEPQEIFERYRLALLVTTRDTFPAQALGSLPVVFFDEKLVPRLSLRRHRPEENGAGPIPSLIFSSGSSGRPKALKTTESGVLQVIDSFQEKFSLRQDDLFLIFLPFHSYQQRLMVYGCLKFGFDAAVVRPTDLFKALKDFGPTLCLAPPILYETVQKKFAEGLRSQSAACPACRCPKRRGASSPGSATVSSKRPSAGASASCGPAWRRSGARRCSCSRRRACRCSRPTASPSAACWRPTRRNRAASAR
jgi:long-subunit acyl-CoA synthetase (AMP-forming)